MASYTKYYVVWKGRHPGIYESWEDCKAETDGFPDARYKAFSSRTDAIMAYRESDREASEVLKMIAHHLEEEEDRKSFENNSGANTVPPKAPIPTPIPKYGPDVILDSIAVDASCQGNPGIMEYRGVVVRTGQQIFKVGPYKKGTNNIGEFLAIVHGLALLKQKNSTIPIYSDSMVAQKWVREKKCKTTLVVNEENKVLIDLIQRAENWLRNNTYSNRIIKWNTESWGEIPADFGRK